MVGMRETPALAVSIFSCTICFSALISFVANCFFCFVTAKNGRYVRLSLHGVIIGGGGGGETAGERRN